MRKHQQKQILELLQTVGEAQKAGLYADCQQGALTIGEYIESIEGEGTETVALLEEYCEKVFQASNGEATEKALKKQLIKVENSIKNELKPNKTEMAFLSYKASMSDCLESIYLTAKKDPMCDAYWIPIPYYDRNPDGSFGQMHFEGTECYDSEIFECTGWQEYDIEARHPDVIFTFNPYDEINYVTSVHPDFYCKCLRELTDCLVYVPYFVVSGVPNDDFAPFCVSPGCVYADAVFLQSDLIRDAYIKYFTKAYGREYRNPGKKFITAGSPKIDKVLNSKREDFKLPEQWQKLIAGRKAVFYNTSVSAILKGGKQYLKKLRHVHKMYKESNNLVLWWRPHPLSVTTYESMRSGLASEYIKITEEYKKEGFGIYDDTPELHRAIAHTDIYYGDSSSLIALYQAAGKPVIMQDINTTGNSIPINLSDIVTDSKGRMWGYGISRDGLFSIDIENNTARYVTRSGILPWFQGKKKMHSFMRYTKISAVNDEIICLPNHHDKIFIYNQSDNNTKEVMLDGNYLLFPGLNGFCIYNFVEYQGKLYCFGLSSKAVVVFDCADHSVQYHTQLYDNIGLTCNYNESTYTRFPIYISKPADDGSVTLLMEGKGELVSYLLKTNEVIAIKTNPALSQCILAEFDGDNYWLITDKYDRLIKYNPETEQTSQYNITDAGFTVPDVWGVFAGLSDCGTYLLLFPGIGNEILKFDKQTEQFCEYNKMPVPDDRENKIYKYGKPSRIENKIYAMAPYNNAIYELDIPSDKVTEHKLQLDSESCGKFINDYLNCAFSPEGRQCSDNDYLFDINREIGKVIDYPICTQEGNQTYSAASIPGSGTAGRIIYETVMKAVTI